MDVRPALLVSLACRQQGVPLAVLARAMGVARRTMQRWDAGNPPPRGPALLLLRFLADARSDELSDWFYFAIQRARRKNGRPAKSA